MTIENTLRKIVKEEIHAALSGAEHAKEILAELQAIKAMMEVEPTPQVEEATPEQQEPTQNVKPVMEQATPIQTPPSPVATAQEEKNIDGITYAALIENGWTDEQISVSQYAPLLPINENVPAFDREGVIARIINRVPGVSYHSICLQHVARVFGKPSIDDVTDTELANTEKVEEGINSVLTFIAKAKGEAVPPPPATETPTPPAITDTTADLLAKDAAGGSSVPPAPIFTPRWKGSRLIGPFFKEGNNAT